MNDLATRKLEVWKLPPIWGTPSPSPFVIKLETWLRMADIPYEVALLRGPPRSKTGKIPYVTLPNGELLADSGEIIERLSRDHDVDLDDGLTQEQRARAHLVRRTVEEHLYFIGAWERWISEAGFAATATDYFAHLPAPQRFVVPRVIRRRIRRYLHGQGLGRMTSAQRYQRARADLLAIATLLEPEGLLVGPPCSADATLFSFLWAMSAHPFVSPLQDLIAGDPRLTSYIDRMRERYWANWTA